MEIEKRNRIVARALGLSLDQVSTYLVSVLMKPNGSWLASFSDEIQHEPDVRSKIPAWKIALISEADVSAGADGQ